MCSLGLGDYLFSLQWFLRKSVKPIREKRGIKTPGSTLLGLALLRLTRKATLQATFHFDEATLKQKFGRTVQADSSIYHIASAEEIRDEFAAMAAKNKGLPPDRKGKTYSCRMILPAGARERLETYEEEWAKAIETCSQEGKRPPWSYYCSLSQNLSHGSREAKIIPALIKNSLIWSSGARRVLVAREHLAVHGWPLYQQLSWCPLPWLMSPEWRAAEGMENSDGQMQDIMSPPPPPVYPLLGNGQKRYPK